MQIETALLRFKLLQKSLELRSKRAQSWLIKCPVNDTEQLAIARELGFQPIKLYQCWLPPLKLNSSDKLNTTLKLPNDLEWQRVTKASAPLLWQLEQSNCSSHLRQIFDKQWEDLLDQDHKNSGVLIAKSNTDSTAIAGLLKGKSSHKNPIFELFRDVSWDSRIEYSLNVILRMLAHKSPKLTLETIKEDERLNHLLDQLEWERQEEKMLLVRSSWKRQMNNKMIKGAKSLETLFGKIQPQNPPIPNPINGGNECQ